MKHVDDQLAANPWLVGDTPVEADEPQMPSHLKQLREAIEAPPERKTTPAAQRVSEKLLQSLERMHASAKYSAIKVRPSL
jgi:hypothetical protein